MALVGRATRSNPDVPIRRMPKPGHYMEVGANGPISDDDVAAQLLQWLRRRRG